MSTLPRIPNARQLLKVCQCFRKGHNITAVLPLSRTFNIAQYNPAALGAGKPFPEITRWHYSSFKLSYISYSCAYEMLPSIWEEKDLHPYFL